MSSWKSRFPYQFFCTNAHQIPEKCRHFKHWPPTAIINITWACETKHFSIFFKKEHWYKYVIAMECHNSKSAHSISTHKFDILLSVYRYNTLLPYTCFCDFSLNKHNFNGNNNKTPTINERIIIINNVLRFDTSFIAWQMPGNGTMKNYGKWHPSRLIPSVVGGWPFAFQWVNDADNNYYVVFFYDDGIFCIFQWTTEKWVHGSETIYARMGRCCAVSLLFCFSILQRRLAVSEVIQIEFDYNYVFFPGSLFNRYILDGQYFRS